MLCYNTELLEFPQQNSMCQIFLFIIANLKLFDAFLKAHFPKKSCWTYIHTFQLELSLNQFHDYRGNPENSSTSRLKTRKWEDATYWLRLQYSSLSCLRGWSHTIWLHKTGNIRVEACISWLFAWEARGRPSG